MKDPLSSEPSPYEVLGVPTSATGGDIEAAFKQGLARRGHPGRLSAARKALLDPVERALVDAFQFDDAVLPRLSPNPARDASCLSGPQRLLTARAWEAQLKRMFPDPGVTHAIGVLWFFSALAEGERLESGFRPRDATAAWEGALVSFASVLEGGERLADAPAAARTDAPGRIAQRLTARVQDLAQACRQRAQKEAADELAALVVAFESERRAARALREAEVTVANRPIAAGPRLLERMGLLTPVRAQLERSRRQHPAHALVCAASEALSPFADVRRLLENDRPEAALDQLARLAPVGDGSEGQALRAQAALALGRQRASLGKGEEALAALEDGLRSAPDPRTAGAICEEVVRTVQAAGRQGDSDHRIALFERGLKLAPQDSKLQLGLAELLTTRAIGIINKLQGRLSGDGPAPTREEAMATLRGAVADLERGSAFGLDRARTNLEQAQELIREMESGMAGLPPEVVTLVAQANEAVDTGNFDRAVELLRRAIKKAKPRNAEALHPFLAVTLNARAVNALNLAMETAERFGEINQGLMAADVSRFFAGHIGADLQRGGTSDSAQGSWIRRRRPAILCIAAGIAIAALGKAIGWEFLLNLGGFIAVFCGQLGPLIASLFGRGTQGMPRYNGPPCSVAGCSASADRLARLPDLGERALCARHAELLRALLARPAGSASSGLYSASPAVTAALTDLNEAVRLDPSSTRARENLAQAKALARELGVKE